VINECVARSDGAFRDRTAVDDNRVEHEHLQRHNENAVKFKMKFIIRSCTVRRTVFRRGERDSSLEEICILERNISRVFNAFIVAASTHRYD